MIHPRVAIHSTTECKPCNFTLGLFILLKVTKIANRRSLGVTKHRLLDINMKVSYLLILLYGGLYLGTAALGF